MQSQLALTQTALSPNRKPLVSFIYVSVFSVRTSFRGTLNAARRQGLRARPARPPRRAGDGEPEGEPHLKPAPQCIGISL